MIPEDPDRVETRTWGLDGPSVEPREPSGPASAETPAEATDDPTLPETIGNYRILSKLGEGGMGVVYAAVQNNPRREVALKIVRGGRYSDPLHVRMFQREVDTLGRLRHPSIAAIYESGVTEEGQHFLAMELVRGVTLTNWLKLRAGDVGSPAELRLRLGLFREICHAVAYAHQRGVIHRDIKPSNVLITERTVDSSDSTGSSGSLSSPGQPDVKILDFGLARITEVDQPGATLLTEAGKVQGTLPYMSPEQVRGDTADIDLRTDVYALGVVLYELLTGRLPYDLHRAGLPEAARAICEDPPLPLTRSWTGRKKLDRDISTIVLKALEKKPDRRYQSVSALVDDIERYLSDQPISARPPSAAYQLRKLIARHKLAFGAATAMLVLIVASAIGMTALYFRQQVAARKTNEAYEKLDLAYREIDAEKQLAEQARRRAEAERERADASRDEIQRNLDDLERIVVPSLQQQQEEYETRERSLREQLDRSEAQKGRLETELEVMAATPPRSVDGAEPPADEVDPLAILFPGWRHRDPAGGDLPAVESAAPVEVRVADDADNPMAHVSMMIGRSWLQQGDFAKAVENLTRAYDAFDEGPEKDAIREMLITALENSEDIESIKKIEELKLEQKRRAGEGAWGQPVQRK